MKNRNAFIGGLSLILLLSGAAGLSYEVVWLRTLSNTLGSSSVATMTILAVFMGGMALGSMVVGRVADRFGRPLVLYGILEIVLAVCALLIPHCMGFVEQLDRLLGQNSTGAVAMISRATAAAAILFIPSFVMGGTLPAIAADLARRGNQAGKWFNVVYGIHMIGAASGALIGSFYLIPELGLAGTGIIGAVVNGTVALAAFGLARIPVGEKTATDESETSEEDVTSGEALPPASPLPWILTAFLSGFIILATESVMVRILVMSLMAKVHTFALMLSVFLLGLSLGSLLAGWLPRRWVNRQSLAAILLVGSLGLLIGREVPMRGSLAFLIRARQPDADISVVNAGWITPIAKFAANEESAVQPSEYVWVSFTLSAACLLPIAVPLGMVLPLVLRRVAFTSNRIGRQTGTIIFWNTIGAVTGPLCVPYLLIPTFSLQGTLWLFAAIVGAMGAAWSLPTVFRGENRSHSLAFLGGVAVVVMMFVYTETRFEGSPELDCTRNAPAIINARELPKVYYHREGPTGTVTVVDSDTGERTIRIDGFEAAGAGGRHYQYMKVMAHLPALLFGPDDIENSLVICCGTGGTAGAMSLYSSNRTDIVDIHREVFECLPWFKKWNHNLHENPRCNKIVDDGRAFLRRHVDAYDVITLEPMPPQFAGMTQLYSVEFYKSCRRALRDDGVVCQWLPLHLVTGEQGLAMVRAMVEVFETVQLWEHGPDTTILIGSARKSLPLKRSHFNAMMKREAARRELLAANLPNELAIADNFLCNATDIYHALDRVFPIRDDEPSLEYSSIGYGLRDPPSVKEIELRREPYIKARLQATIPLAGFAPELRSTWKSLSVIHFTFHLARMGRPGRAFLVDQIRRNPELRKSPIFMDQARRILGQGAPAEPRP